MDARRAHYNGREGVWFTDSDAERLLDVVERRLPAAMNVVRDQRRIIKLQRIQVRTATQALAAQDDVLAQQRQLTQVILDAYEEEASRNDSIWREPALWVTVGVAVAAGVLGVGFAVSK